MGSRVLARDAAERGYKGQDNLEAANTRLGRTQDKPGSRTSQPDRGEARDGVKLGRAMDAKCRGAEIAGGMVRLMRQNARSCARPNLRLASVVLGRLIPEDRHADDDACATDVGVEARRLMPRDQAV